MVVEDVLGGTALPISAREQEQRGKAWQRAPSSGHWEPTGSPAGCRERLGSPARVARRWVRRHEAAGPRCVCSSWFPSRRGQGRAPQIVQLAASCRACCNKKRGWAVVQPLARAGAEETPTLQGLAASPWHHVHGARVGFPAGRAVWGRERIPGSIWLQSVFAELATLLPGQ